MVNKENNKVTVIDVDIPWDTRVVEKGREKIEKYQDLKIELRRIWQSEDEEEPIFLGTLGLIPDDLKRKVGCTNLEPGLLQESVLLATARIVKRVMDS